MSVAFYQNFRSALTGDGPTMAIANQIYRGHPTQSPTSPYVVFLTVSESPQEDLEGEGPLRNELVQVDCYATDADTAENLWQAAKTALYASANFQLVRNNKRQLFEDDTGLHRVSVDLSCWFTE